MPCRASEESECHDVDGGCFTILSRQADESLLRERRGGRPEGDTAVATSEKYVDLAGVPWCPYSHVIARKDVAFVRM
jgi:hypothetical protein